MAIQTSKDPLNGITLETIVKALVQELGWEKMSEKISVHCFLYDPSVSSSLKFLRKTPWARKKVEELYLSVRSSAPADPAGK
jgi:uncharacterized protein (DUF2132 family)